MTWVGGLLPRMWSFVLRVTEISWGTCVHCIGILDPQWSCGTPVQKINGFTLLIGEPEKRCVTFSSFSAAVLSVTTGGEMCVGRSWQCCLNNIFLTSPRAKTTHTWPRQTPSWWTSPLWMRNAGVWGPLSPWNMRTYTRLCGSCRKGHAHPHAVNAHFHIVELWASKSGIGWHLFIQLLQLCGQGTLR